MKQNKKEIRGHCTTERVLNFEFFLPAGVESSQILQRRHSRTVSVGAANPRPFTDSKNSVVPNNLHPNNKIEQPHTMSVPNGTVMSERPSSPQKPKRPVSCRSELIGFYIFIWITVLLAFVVRWNRAFKGINGERKTGSLRVRDRFCQKLTTSSSYRELKHRRRRRQRKW